MCKKIKLFKPTNQPIYGEHEIRLMNCPGHKNLSLALLTIIINFASYQFQYRERSIYCRHSDSVPLSLRTKRDYTMEIIVRILQQIFDYLLKFMQQKRTLNYASKKNFFLPLFTTFWLCSFIRLAISNQTKECICLTFTMMRHKNKKNNVKRWICRNSICRRKICHIVNKPRSLIKPSLRKNEYYLIQNKNKVMTHLWYIFLFAS